ncbi:AI-2E family transporter [Pseudochryseolinea flava]|nr:AI-2E family transporter [Pseudochryseolinea flava]
MSTDFFKDQFPFRFAAVLICIIGLIYISAQLQAVVVPLIFSTIFAVMLYPLTCRLERWRFPRGLAAITSILIAAIFIGTTFYFLGTQMAELGGESEQLLTKLKVLTKDVQAYISSHFGIKQSEQVEQIENQVTQVKENGGKIVAAIITAVANFLRDMTLIPLFVFFFLYFRDFLLEFFHRAFSAENKIIDEIISKMYDIIQSWFTGVVVVMLIVGILNTVGLLILGIPYAAFFGFLASALLVVPFIGIIFGSFLPVVMALITKDSYWYAVGVVGVFWVIQVLEANIITPYVVGSKISINPMIAILVLILFGKLWGISGLILALPVTAMCKIIFDAVPGMSPYGFVLGEPGNEHLQNRSAIEMQLDDTKDKLEKKRPKIRRKRSATTVHK